MDLLSERSEPFSETWPIWGMTRGGESFGPTKQELLTGANGSSSSHALPTPQAARGESTTETAYLLGGTRSDASRPQGEVLLKTPTSNLGSNGGSQHPNKRKSGGHGPTLADEIEHLLPLLPTPRTTDSHGIGVHGQGGQDLRTTVAYLDDLDALLPTPTVGNVTGGNKRRGGDRSDELLLPGVADEVEETGTWGPFQPAIDRWEAASGRPAPDPTNPDGKGGAHRMNAALPEWMMGYPAGHLTDVPGNSRADALKQAGNGVVPQQAALAAVLVLGGWD